MNDKYFQVDHLVKEAVVSGLVSFGWTAIMLVAILAKGEAWLHTMDLFSRLIICLEMFLPWSITLYLCISAIRAYHNVD